MDRDTFNACMRAAIPGIGFRPGDLMECEGITSNPCVVVGFVDADNRTGRPDSYWAEDANGQKWNVVASKCRPYRRA